MQLFKRDKSNDDLLLNKPAQGETGKQGWTPGGGRHGPGVEGSYYDTKIGNPYDTDVNRLRARGNETQAPVRLDEEQADYSRKLQMGSLGLLRKQADGSAPSSAEILSQRANQNAGSAAARGVASARGPGAGVAAFGGANDAAMNQAMGQNVQNAGVRAGEISRGQGAYAAGGLAAQGQDISAATTNAQLQAQQRALNETRQQANERLAWDTRHSQMTNRAEYDRQMQRAEHNQRVATNAEEKADYDEAKGYVDGTVGAVMGGIGIGSDERLKMNIGSLGHLMRGKR